MNRIDALDWHRGLLACAVMVYHLTSWQLFKPDSASFLGRLGVYAVAMFFVLSGLSMALVYHDYLRSFRASINFYIRRIFRIWPMLWLAVGLSVTAALVGGKHPDWLAVLSNLTTAFAFTNPSGYLNTGAWSLGNEMVYYALTPFLIAAYNRRLAFGNLLTGLAFALGMLFATRILSTGQTLGSQWATYIDPFNNLFLYCAGIAIFYNARQVRFGTTARLACFAVSLGLFLFYPVSGDQIHIVTGASRIVFCFASVLLVLGFYKAAFSVPKVVAIPLTQLGLMTYGVYLLHPLVYSSVLMGCKKLGVEPGASVVIGLSVLSTLVAAPLVYRVLEAPCVRMGKRLTSRPHAGKPQDNQQGREPEVQHRRQRVTNDTNGFIK